MVNHFNKNGAFTTKIGLCSNLRNLSWFSPQSSDDFFPRCYKLSQEDDKLAFIDDYRLTCCIGLLKFALISYKGYPDEDFLDVHITSSEELIRIKDEAKKNDPDSSSENTTEMIESNKSIIVPIRSNKPKKSVIKLTTYVPVEAIDFAIRQINEFIDFHENNDIDMPIKTLIPDEKWLKFYEWFYAACQ